MIFDYQVNYIAIVLAAIVYFILGGIWYSPKVFGQFWMRHEGVHFEQKPPVWVYFVEFLLDLLTAYVLAVFISMANAVNWREGVLIAFMSWLGFVLTYQLSGLIWGKKTYRTVLVNGGFALVGLLIMGAILGGMG